MLSLTGCGQNDKFERVAVAGRVTYNGTPVESGRIRFLPAENTLTPPTAAYITDGIYRVEHRGGVPVGSFRVAIEGYSGGTVAASDSSGGRHTLDDDPRAFGKVQQFIPAKFNKETELTMQVDSGQREITKDWELVP
jgi:hypothetical protein